jgi:hypothetical protein
MYNFSQGQAISTVIVGGWGGRGGKRVKLGVVLAGFKLKEG